MRSRPFAILTLNLDGNGQKIKKSLCAYPFIKRKKENKMLTDVLIVLRIKHYFNDLGFACEWFKEVKQIYSMYKTITS